MRHAICYISNLDEDLDLVEIEALLSHWQKKNETRGIKGLLLYSEGNFFQILEGEKNIVLKMFEKIEEDNRHNGIIQVVGRDIQQGSYDGYIVDILEENDKLSTDLPAEYFEALKGIEPDLKKTMERMLMVFTGR